MSKVSPFPTAKLAEVVDILDNLRVPINSAERMGRAGTVPYYGANGFQGWIDRPLFNEPLILLAEDGGNFDDFATRPIAYRIDGPAWVNNHAHIIRAKNGVSQSFIFWSIVNKDIRKYIAGGTRTKLTQGELRRIEINFPIEREQEAIAKVLDTLDTAIHETEAIIAKLKAIKQGLLHDLLTRGIDANGELRPSQAEAPHLYKEAPLGWIPKEWRAECLSDITTLVTSGSRGWAAHYSDVGDLFVRSQNIRIGRLDFSDRQYVSPPMGGEGQRTRLDSLDLLITITGNGVGNVAHIPDGWAEVAYVSQHVGLVRFLEPPLALLATQFLVQGAPGNRQLLDAQYGQSKPGLSLDNLRNLCIPVPRTTERELIVDRLSCAQERVEEESQYANQLRELKVGLMEDLLTGRVRVTPLLADAVQK